MDHLIPQSEQELYPVLCAANAHIESLVLLLNEKGVYDHPVLTAVEDWQIACAMESDEFENA